MRNGSLFPGLVSWLSTSILAILLTATCPAIAGVESLPDLGSSAQKDYSVDAETRIGNEAMRYIRRSSTFVDDPELEAYIQNLGNRLIAAGDTRDRPFQFFLIRDPSINAFALPGGFIGIHTGLITSAETESELAAVLAHEIIHVSQNHWSRTMAARKDRSGLTAAAILASVVLASSGQTVGEAGIALTAAIELQQELSYSRAYERESDRIGIKLLNRAGFDADAMGNFFSKLQESTRLSETGPEYLRTHPITTNRIAEARDRARMLPAQKRASNRQRDFLHAKARIIAQFTRASSSADSLLRSKIAPASRDAYDYGQALLLIRSGHTATASRLIKPLRAKHPNNLRYQMLQADNDLKSGNIKKGLNRYRSVYKNTMYRRDILIRYAIALINHNQFETSFRILKPAIKYPAVDPRLQKLFARAAGETGRLTDSHRSLAEYYYLHGDTPAALQQLRIAKSQAGDNKYSLAGIEARRKEIETAR